MATLHPTSFDSLRQDAGLYRELDVIERLNHSLPDSYEVFHSISWFSVHNTHDRHGEIDVIVMSPEGNLVLVEVKSGNVVIKNGEMFKVYKDKQKDVCRQSKVQYSAIVNRLTEAKLNPFVTNCLVLPDFRIDGAHLVGFPQERIISSENYDNLGSIIRSILAAAPVRQCNVDAVRRFLNNEFQVSIDLTILQGQISKASHRLSDGMSSWVPRIKSPSGRVRIEGTAGSGKTQLALKLLSDAATHKQKSLYVCFNRSLADHIRRISPPNANVTNFHELCVDYYRRHIGEPDFNDPDIFSKAARSYIANINQQEPNYDLVILDEGQDFEPAWVRCFLDQVKPEGRFYLMEDQDQGLYLRDEFDLEGAVVITSDENFRSPRLICELINAYGFSSHPIQGKGPYMGDIPQFRVYHDEDELVSMTALATQSLLDQGFDLADIVVLSGHGRSRSTLLNLERIGKFSTRHFTGKYTSEGDQIWTSGDLTAESIYRFKGQSAVAIVLSEIDFLDMTELERRKLFVGLTRAQMMVEIVLSHSAEQWFQDALKAG